jgi:Sec-independent protein translocase protein TatA
MISFGEIFLLALVLLLFWHPKLPQWGRSAGKGVRALKKSFAEDKGTKEDSKKLDTQGNVKEAAPAGNSERQKIHVAGSESLPSLPPAPKNEVR